MVRKILLIDDDRLQFRLTQQYFKVFRTDTYELVWSATYEDGLAKLLVGDYAACLLDYRLGARDGLDLIREAKSRGCRVPIIFLTAEQGESVDIKAMHAGALDYLVKGEITSPMLERALRYALKLSETLEAMRLLATRDQLTGLLNRREFDRILHEEMERSHRFKHSFALIILDLDHFKRVNDTHGHLAGDELLQEVARRLTGAMRSVDRVIRLGGEEFVVIMVEADETMAMALAERLRVKIANQPVALAGAGIVLAQTVSGGMAIYPRDAADAAGIIGAADQALYAAKADGRNRVVAYAGPSLKASE